VVSVEGEEHSENWAFQHVARHPLVRAVLFRKSRFLSDEGLAHLASLRYVETLELGGFVGDEGGVYLGGLMSLRQLLLENTAVTDRGLAFLRGLVNLVSLSIGMPASGTGLAHLESLSKLRSLSISAPLTDAGLALLARLPISRLELSGLRATREGILQLRDMDADIEIHRSDLSHDEIRDLESHFGRRLYMPWPGRRYLGRMPLE
jgi:hypothetical protein